MPRIEMLDEADATGELAEIYKRTKAESRVYDTALFNLFVRLADAFDIKPPPMYEGA